MNMQGYWPSPEDETIEQKLKNVQDAIKLRDDGYVFQTLGSQPALITATDSKNETLLMFARRNGCSEQMRGFLEKKSAESTTKIDESTPNSTERVVCK
jgi:hypothetical protein